MDIFRLEMGIFVVLRQILGKIRYELRRVHSGNIESFYEAQDEH